MRPRFRRPLAFILLGAAVTVPALAQDAAISFEKDLMPTLKRRCAACHITGEEPGRMALVPGKAYGYLVGIAATELDMKRVEPFEPDKSYLIHKLQGTHLDAGGSGVRMPFHQPPLKAALVEKFRRWIAEGAADN